MKIEFKIEEKMPEIIREILHSDKYHSTVKDEGHGLQRVVIKDAMHNIVAFVEIWKQEIHIKTPCECATYRIFHKQDCMVCEYIGALQELLNQEMIPKLTPVNGHFIYDGVGVPRVPLIPEMK
jgi:hypothetical protein